MNITIIRSWKNFRVGESINPPGVLAQWLVRQGYARLREPPREVAAVAAPEQAVIAQPPRRKAGRRRP